MTEHSRVVRGPRDDLPGRGLDALRWLATRRLVQFLTLGGLIFAITPAPRADEQIRLASADLEPLLAARARQLGVPALSPAEGAAVRIRALEDEVLYREARRLALDEGDAVVRQRLIQKMLFLAEELGGAGAPPDEAALRSCYAQAPERFLRPARVHLVHIFAGSPATLRELRPQALRWRPSPSAPEPPPLGESFPMRRLIHATLPEVAAQYGTPFADALLGLPIGAFSQPISSKFGWHLVLLLDRQAAGPASFDEARPELELGCWLQRREEAVAQLLGRIASRYHLEIGGQAQPPLPRTRRLAARSEASGED